MTLAFDTNHFEQRADDGASSSASVTIGASCEGATLLINMYDGTGDTIAALLAGNNPTTSDQEIISGNRAYAAAWVGVDLPSSGSQTLAWSGGDTGDTWNKAFATWTGIDTTTPYDGFHSLAPVASTPDAISIVSTSDGVVHAMIIATSNPTVAGGGTQIGEASGGSDSARVNHQRKAGTGASLSMSWTAGGTTYGLVGINVRAGSGADNLLADDIASATSVGSPAIGQVHGLLVDDLASAVVLGTPTLTLVVSLFADDLVCAVSLGVPALGQAHALLADDLASAVVLGAPALAEVVHPPSVPIVLTRARLVFRTL